MEALAAAAAARIGRGSGEGLQGLAVGRRDGGDRREFRGRQPAGRLPFRRGGDLRPPRRVQGRPRAALARSNHRRAGRYGQAGPQARTGIVVGWAKLVRAKRGKHAHRYEKITWLFDSWYLILKVGTALRAFAHPTMLRSHAARLCITPASVCAPRIAATERSTADHSRAISCPAAESGATSPALKPAASEAM